MKIAYCTNVRLPSERAHGHQIAQVCDALAELGHRITVFAPERQNDIKESYQVYYNANRHVQIQYIKGFDHTNSPLPIGPFGLWFDNVLLRKQLPDFLKKEKFDLLYTRAPALLPALLKTGVPTVLELHSLPTRNKKAFVDYCRQCKLVVCLTTAMKKELVGWGVDAKHVVVEADAVDPSIFANVVHLDTWRRTAHIPDGASVIGYAGQLESMGLSKGVEVILEAMEYMDSCHALLAGGPDLVAQRMMSSLPNSLKGRIHFLGVLPHQDVPSMLRACDVLVYPAPKSNHVFYNRDTSPLKLFEYMAAEKPIVCADLPPLRDIVDEDCVFFFEPGNSKHLAEVVQSALESPDVASKKVAAAKERVQKHTWSKRMERVLSVIK